MRFLTTTLLLFFGILSAVAQHSISGKIIDDQKEKQGLFMSASELAIQSLASLPQDKKYLFILSVNHENDAIVSQHILARCFNEVKIVSAHSPVDIINEIKCLT